MLMAVQKVIFANDTVNGSAYINPNSLVIPPTTVQRVDSPALNEAIEEVSGVLHDRLNDPRYYTGDTAS